MTTSIPADFGKMPPNYDFSHKGINWSDYRNDFKLRTDAVWEKEQLKNWFRLYYKCFYYDTFRGGYRIIEPEDFYTMTMEPWCTPLSMIKFKGHNLTGRTNSFQIGQAPRREVSVSHTIYQSQQDYWTLCAFRFDKWMECDLANNMMADTKPEKLLKKYKDYPCYGVFYEAQSACQDDAFDFLMEIHYYRKANQVTPWQYENHEMMKPATIFDSPSNAERVKKTY